MTDNPGWASPSSSSDDAPEQAAAPHDPNASQEPGQPSRPSETGAAAEAPSGGPGASGASGASGDMGGSGGSGESAGSGTQSGTGGGAPSSDPSRGGQQDTPRDTPPNWSKEQPPPADWTTPGWGGDTPGGSGGTGGTQQAPPGWNAGQGWGGGQQPPPQQGWGQGPAAWGKPPAAKPGIIPLRPLGVGEILDGAVSTMRAHWRTVLGVSLVVALITQAVSTVATWWMFNGLDAELDALDSDPDPSLGEVMDVFTGLFAGLGVAQAITVLGTLVVTAMLTMVVSRSVLGRPVTAADAWRDAKPRLLKLLGLTLLIPLIVAAVVAVALAPSGLALIAGSEALAITLFVLGALAAVCVATWLLVRFSLASPALMLEKQGVFKAMARSTRLVRGSWWRVFGILLLTAIITMIISSIVQTPFTVLSLFMGGESMGSFLSGESSGGLSIPALVVTGIGAAIGMTIAFPISAGVTALLYIDQRIRREALDIDLARAAGVPGYDAPHAQPPAAPATGN